MSDDASVSPSDAREWSGDALQWTTLDAGEEIQWRGQPRKQTIYPWIALSLAVAVGIVGAIVVGVLPALAILAVPLAAVPAACAFLWVTRTEYLVTSAAVYARRGILGVQAVSVEFDRIQNTAASQHALGALVGYGTVEIDTAGSEGAEVTFRNVEDPQAVRVLIDEHIERSVDEVPGTREQWEAVLAEVRRWRAALESD